MTIKIRLRLVGVILGLSINSHAMTSLSDDDLRQTHGQALWQLQYLAPTDAGNPNNNIGFYRVGLNAEMAINANIKRLRLGCGGVNNAINSGLCDIDFENFRLTGIVPSSAVDVAPSTDAILTNPFFEVAIRNPNQASTREVVGLRFGAQNVLGAFTIGENPDTNRPDETGEFGIHSFSGRLNADIYDVTVPLGLCSGLGFANSTRTGCSFGSFELLSGSATINNPSTNNHYYTSKSGTRLTEITAEGIPLRAVLPVLGLPITININANLVLALKNLHRFDLVNTPDFFLSVQKENLSWRMSDQSWTNVNRGWWMEVPKAEISGITAQKTYVGQFEAIGAIIGFDLTAGPVDVGQRPIDNCYGSLTFC